MRIRFRALFPLMLAAAIGLVLGMAPATDSVSSPGVRQPASRPLAFDFFGGDSRAVVYGVNFGVGF